MTGTRDVWTELLTQKAEIRQAIARSNHDNTKLRELTDWLGRELDLEARYKGLLSEAERLIAQRRPVADRSAAGDQFKRIDSAGWTFAGLEKGERARLARSAYFDQQREMGKTYAKVGRIYYRGEDGAILGVTFSSDKGGKSWFLNLKANEFQEAVLLCQTGPRSVKAIHLPRTFIDRYAKQLSEDNKGEVKFNILREAGKWLLEVPQPVGPVDVSSYLSREELTCRRREYI
jgi:hypothetical protein